MGTFSELTLNVSQQKNVQPTPAGQALWPGATGPLARGYRPSGPVLQVRGYRPSGPGLQALWSGAAGPLARGCRPSGPGLQALWPVTLQPRGCSVTGHLLPSAGGLEVSTVASSCLVKKSCLQVRCDLKRYNIDLTKHYIVFEQNFGCCSNINLIYDLAV